MDKGSKRCLSTKDLKFDKKNRRFTGSILENRVGYLCRQILLSSEKTGRIIVFQRYFQTRDALWFGNFKEALVIKILIDNKV
jgi:hypothetical protein